MITFLLAVILHFKPVHVMWTDGPSCGATDRLMRERLTISVGKDTWVHNVKWQRVGDDLLMYRADPDAYMFMSILYADSDAYLTIAGIDARRRPCRDTIYLRRTK